MIRARAAFMACRFDENPHGHETKRLKGKSKEELHVLTGGEAHRQLFSEVLVAEDIDLGSRVHTLGFKYEPFCTYAAIDMHAQLICISMLET